MKSQPRIKMALCQIGLMRSISEVRQLNIA
ncbi:TPA: hypothetical protein ACWRQ7_001771 [Staphylococcus aureus]